MNRGTSCLAAFEIVTQWRILEFLGQQNCWLKIASNVTVKGIHHAEPTEISSAHL